jgi:hypothetical protein
MRFQGLTPDGRCSLPRIRWELLPIGGWLRSTGERRGRYYVLGPGLQKTPAQGEIVPPFA